jgi:hypothetical protein
MLGNGAFYRRKSHFGRSARTNYHCIHLLQRIRSAGVILVAHLQVMFQRDCSAGWPLALAASWRVSNRLPDARGGPLCGGKGP